MRLIDVDKLLEKINDNSLRFHADQTILKKLIESEPEVEAVPCDDNLGFAAYIIENDAHGVRVEEVWNKDLNDEEMLAVMAGVIQDMMNDERLSELWTSAVDLATFMNGMRN